MITLPREPLARFRFYALWFAQFAAAYTLVLILRNGATGPGLAAVGIVSTLALMAIWVWGYRRGRFLTGSFVGESLLLCATGVAGGAPNYALGLFFGAYQFRGLYVPRRRLVGMVLIFAVARLVAIVLAPGTRDSPFSLQSFATLVILAFVATMTNFLGDGMTRQAAADRALQRSEERYRLVASATRDVIYEWSIATGIVEWTESMQAVFGYTTENVGNDLTWALERVHPDDRARLNSAMTGSMTETPGAAPDSFRFRFRRADGSYAAVSATGLVQRDAHGAPVRVIGSIRDCTQQQHLEDELRQAHKMEAVGQLAGGVAHDFNNLLTVIGGHVYLLRQRLPGNEVAARQLDGIANAADRGASLTRQLLTFSRKQMLSLARLNLNTVVDDTAEMIRRLIGENIRLATELDANVPAILADEGQIGQLLITLAVNARDAMPNGGLLTIETDCITLPLDSLDARVSGLSSGEYVRLVIRDTGIGMDATTRARAFEPFFTTKAAGKGTGLGLSTVYGIVKQSAGDIWIDSAPGAGAAFSILLPAAPEPSEDTSPREPRISPITPRSAIRERILLVEDDDGVRDFASGVLVEAGYEVFCARNGLEGLAVAKEQRYMLDGIVTDVVMPEMGGRAMIDRLRVSLPGARVLYISGYTDDVHMLSEIRASDATLLEKPFTAESLTLAVRGPQPARQPVA